MSEDKVLETASDSQNWSIVLALLARMVKIMQVWTFPSRSELNKSKIAVNLG
jgi:hypothetical protein